jgi:hypothetical protein
MRSCISLLLPVLGLLSAADPTWACGGRAGRDLGRAVAMITTITSTGPSEWSVKRRVDWNIPGTLHAGEAGSFRLAPDTDSQWAGGDSGENDIVAWRISSRREDGEVTVHLTGKREGRTQIPVRYVPKQGSPGDVALSLSVGPPAPPVPPPTLSVEGDTFTGSVSEHRTFQIRLMKPLQEGYRWDIKEAQYLPYGGDEEKWLPLDNPEPRGEAGLFWASAQGKRARIVFVQKRDGWQPFPDTVTLDLNVWPTPKC